MVREAGERAGEPNDCTTRLVQRWEAGEVTAPRGNYARALEAISGQPVENLGFRLGRDMTRRAGSGCRRRPGAAGQRGEGQGAADRNLEIPLRIPFKLSWEDIRLRAHRDPAPARCPGASQVDNRRRTGVDGPVCRRDHSHWNVERDHQRGRLLPGCSVLRSDTATGRAIRSPDGRAVGGIRAVVRREYGTVAARSSDCGRFPRISQKA